METEEINIKEYIDKDKDNVIIMYGKNKYFFTKRSIIEKQYNGSVNIFYGCKKATGVIGGNYETSQIYLKLRTIGLVVSNEFCDIDVILDNPDRQLFVKYDLNKKYPSFVSKNIADEGGSWVSGLHCQAGHASGVSKMVFGYASDKDNEEELTEKSGASGSAESGHGTGAAASGAGVGGRKKRRTRKHRGKKRKHPKRRKPRKSTRKPKRRVKKRKQTKRRRRR